MSLGTFLRGNMPRILRLSNSVNLSFTEEKPQASPIEVVYDPAAVEFRKHVLAEEEPQASPIEGGL